MALKTVKPADRMVAELKRIRREIDQVLAEYQAATGSHRRKNGDMVLSDPENGKKYQVKRRNQ